MAIPSRQRPHLSKGAQGIFAPPRSPMNQPIKAPYPYFGGKSKIAAKVWDRFGAVDNFVEPFFGSGAMLLANPNWPKCMETTNDLNAYIVNFWRAVAADPDAVAHHAEWPVSEVDLEARHKWLVRFPWKHEFANRLKDDPDYFDAKAAGWWVWGASCWIGAGWCEGEWHGRGVNTREGGGELPHLSLPSGVNAPPPNFKRPALATAGKGVVCQRPHLGGSGISGTGVFTTRREIRPWMEALSSRFRRVRLVCGGWDRVLGPSVTTGHGMTAVFLDPPYPAEANRADCYTHESATVAHDAAAWAIANGGNPLLRIAFCGYGGTHVFPREWRVLAWKTAGGYGNQKRGKTPNVNAGRERIWFSPGCLEGPEPDLFGGEI